MIPQALLTILNGRCKVTYADCYVVFLPAGVGVAQNPYSLYSAMHSYLAGSAVDGVKVDCQAGVGLVGSVLGGGPAAARQFQAALEDSIAQHFPGNHAINCMCHSSENFYRCGWRFASHLLVLMSAAGATGR